MSITVAVVGCMHGEIEKVYASIENIEMKHGIKVELVICTGDVQTLRNEHDLSQLACPDKYKEMGTFHKYYSGEKTAPWPTVFIGGNHEASNALDADRKSTRLNSSHSSIS